MKATTIRMENSVLNRVDSMAKVMNLHALGLSIKRFNVFSVTRNGLFTK